MDREKLGNTQALQDERIQILPTAASRYHAPPMPRRLLNFLSFVSLLLCVATCVLWVRSYVVTDIVEHGSTRRSELGEPSLYVEQGTAVWSRSGNFMLAWMRSENRYPGAADAAAPFAGLAYRTDTEPEIPDSPLALWGLPALGRGVFPIYWATGASLQGLYSSEQAAIEFPHWLAALALTAVPAIRTVKHIRQSRRRSVGLCSSCGYDLRASPERCPECGAKSKDVKSQIAKVLPPATVPHSGHWPGVARRS